MDRTFKRVLLICVGIGVGLGIRVIPGAATAQEVHHAPTVEQCRADQRLWLAKLDARDMDNVSLDELEAWEKEMHECIDVDPQFTWQYYNTRGETCEAHAERLNRFLIRHGLWEEFFKEDAQGMGR